jgi:5'-nucleotidase
MSVERILLTNDDGIDAVGLRALYDALSADYDVVTLAPTGDRSSVGRALSDDVAVTEHELGYAVDGTPVDCVVAGLDEIVPDADLVVAGCNKGANLGAYTLGRSGTVSAAVEAAFFGVPAVAASMYVPGGSDWWKRDLVAANFDNAVRATRFLIDEAPGAGVFDRADYLNVNAPLAEENSDASTGPAPMRATTPSTWYGLEATRNGDGNVSFDDPIWGRMTPADVPDLVGTDRRAVVDGEVSVSPLSVPHAAEPNAGLEALADAYAVAGRP